MTAENQDFSMRSGDDFKLTFIAKDSAGNIIDITGATLIWQLQRSVASAEALVKKATGGSPSEIDLTDPTNGVFRVTLYPIDTAGLGGAYFHEAQMVDSSGNVSTVAVGTATISDDAIEKDVDATSLVVVEDGTALAAANSYASDSEFVAYGDARGHTTVTGASKRTREEALVKAADFMLARYRMKWKGIRVNVDQGLDWPRAGVLLEDYFEPEAGPRSPLYPGLTFVVPENVVRQEVKNAQMELALIALDDDLVSNIPGGIKRLKGGPAEIEYFQGASLQNVYPLVDGMLAPLLRNTGGQRQVVRG